MVKILEWSNNKIINEGKNCEGSEKKREGTKRNTVKDKEKKKERKRERQRENERERVSENERLRVR